jgi:hypothetical protein
MAWDFTCVDTLAPSHLARSAQGPAAAAEDAEKRKAAKYSHLNDYTFAPVCIETFGSWGPGALSLVKDVGRRLANLNNEPRSTSFLIQSLSMAVQRGNAASVIGSMPVGKNLFELLEL